MVDARSAAPLEAGDPTDDSAAFRRCLGQFAKGVTVVTARTGDLHVKRFVEERELTVIVMVDVSASGAYGSAALSKRELAAEEGDVRDPLRQLFLGHRGHPRPTSPDVNRCGGRGEN